MRFSKWHAHGNVYLLTDEPLAPDLVRAEVGNADGIVEIVSVACDTADVVIWNPDGSTAELSGNGTRIAARWLAERTGVTEVRIRVGEREVSARLTNGDVEQDMGEVQVAPREEVAGIEVTPVDVGNPHAVVIGDPADLPRLGPLLEEHPRFTNRTNVQVANVDGPGEVTARVWERGVGETRSSGTSAVAVAAATHGEGDVIVHFPGGDLRVRLEDGHATLTGPAERLRVPRQILVYVHRPGPEFLLLRRIARLDGFWQGVTGAPEWGEPDDDAARRELFEETGLDAANAVTAVDYRYELHPRDDRSRWDQLYGPGVEAVPEEVYAAAAPAGWEPTLSWEHDEYRWCALDEALELLRYAENREGLRAVAHSLSPP